MEVCAKFKELPLRRCWDFVLAFTKIKKITDILIYTLASSFSMFIWISKNESRFQWFLIRHTHIHIHTVWQKWPESVWNLDWMNRRSHVPSPIRVEQINTQIPRKRFIFTLAAHLLIWNQLGDSSTFIYVDTKIFNKGFADKQKCLSVKNHNMYSVYSPSSCSSDNVVQQCFLLSFLRRDKTEQWFRGMAEGSWEAAPNGRSLSVHSLSSFIVFLIFAWILMTV